jgi:phosphatidylglycerol---prolipoprotein diacylglyceryl transferase
MYPRLLHIYGPLWVQSYGVMIVLGFLLFLFLAYHDSRRVRLINSDTFFNTIFVGLVSGIIGGRLLFMISEWSLFENPWLEMFYVWQGGFVVLGSIIGVTLAVPFYLKLYGVPVLKFLDIAGQYTPLLQSVARIGCLLAGCCYGAPSLSKVAVVFSDAQGFAPVGVYLHPTQLYMCLLSFLIFIILFLLRPILLKQGQIAFLYLSLECISRVFIDVFRGDRGELINLSCLHFNLSLSLMQIWSLGFLVISILAFIFVSARRRNF